MRHVSLVCHFCFFVLGIFTHCLAIYVYTFTRHTAHWDSDESIRRFVLSPESQLYQKLCNPNESGECRYANTVTLDENLSCHRSECRVDEVVIVQVKPGTFYEYIRQPCVHLSFYGDAKKVVTGYSSAVAGVGRRHTHAMCAHPETAVAARSCCDVTYADIAEFNYKMVSQARRRLVSVSHLTLSNSFHSVFRRSFTGKRPFLPQPNFSVPPMVALCVTQMV